MHTFRRFILSIVLALPLWGLGGYAQINTDRMMNIARNALAYDDYVLSISYFNLVINYKPTSTNLISIVVWQSSTSMTTLVPSSTAQRPFVVIPTFPTAMSCVGSLTSTSTAFLKQSATMRQPLR